MKREALEATEWVGLISSTHKLTDGEKVVVSVKLHGNNVLLIKKPWMRDALSGIDGLGFRQGEEIQVLR